MGAIAGRQAKRKKPSSPRTAAATIAIAMRRIIESSIGSGWGRLRTQPFSRRNSYIVDKQEASITLINSFQPGCLKIRVTKPVEVVFTLLFMSRLGASWRLVRLRPASASGPVSDRE